MLSGTLGKDVRVVERELVRDALGDATVKRLMTVPGVDVVVALGLAAAIGPISRFKSPDELVSHIGLNPSVHQPVRAVLIIDASPSKAARTRALR